jgi:hypothetical protein
MMPTMDLDALLLLRSFDADADGACALAAYYDDDAQEEQGLEGALRETAAVSTPRTPFDWRASRRSR